ncbi:coiled-coil and C2 domain-containing protein 1B isoform X1 [Corythoichthys intestinalis]|uniref:coiled-coil and C2 domain-containing protein 1B isoform X1 n=1 Tax=Corythoichthys intestinalis TaxID=161448 RepID=UPI0025A5F824|nr:coiled-coil and C2 domain-containing protein 1B isoform X1 [Corythoichthys intestinalis]XP_057713084.1 coiled-coil and C2 domain-containing protein 1B isoform X1 [Corythoichthys intestinalis]XP_057713085.1 coiled-coil and C2 domain-containing protein 1B isoform X1 [Corythoichthys intestinalis]XP_057713086.1 coiled-coil and C2 domain-containing protein 1B isoform X1 [Corythoichthys intestinalis]
MFGKKRREPLPKGRGAAAAKQMGLFLGMDPEDVMTMGAEDCLDDPDLEAELAAITGGEAAPVAGGRDKRKGRSPLPMEDIAKMADECMRDVDEDEDDDNVEDDEDLLAELQEVVGVGSDETEVMSPSVAVSVEPSPQETSTPAAAAVPGSIQHTLEERLAMYNTALHNAKTAGEGAKARRLERGRKTLESMLTTVKKGRQVSEADIPPPVATGAAPARPSAPEVITPDGEEEEQRSSASMPVLAAQPSPVEAAPSPEEAGPSPEEAAPSPTTNTDAVPAKERVTALLLQRQREYKMAALTAKKAGEAEQAMVYFRTSKKFDSVIDALKQGQAVDLSGLPPPPGESPASVKQNAEVAQNAAPASGPPAPKDALEALEQRRAKYTEASAQAKASGDERKARMHDRIAKQYQSAIRSHKAGKAVNFDELPVPPGFPPIPGHKSTSAEQGLVAALETASKLSTTDDAAESADEAEEEKDEEQPKKSTLSVPAASRGRRRSSSASPERTSARDISPAATEQLAFLESRRKQYLKAALHAKQKNDMEQAKNFLRTAKSLEAMAEAARSGKAVDISAVPSPPGDEDEDFVLVHHSDVGLSEKAEQLYAQLAKILRQQREKCLTYSKQFTHLGNVTETTKFEKMAESCKKSMEFLKASQAKGLPPPKHHFEDKTFHTVRMFPDLSSTEMVVVIVKGMNLPAPSGIQTNDLDAYVKFDFPYPSTEQPQRHKTNVIKNTNCPEYNQSFSLSINRNHRGFRRVVTSKGLKLELLHKGGFLRSDKPIGTAHVKLEQLDSHSEIREIVEVMDGRKPTGGRVEVRVRLREPLSGQDVRASVERWLVVEQSQLLV